MIELDGLATAATRGVTGDPPWQDFVRLLRAEFGGSHANLIFRRADLDTIFMTEDFATEVLAAGDPHVLYCPADDPIPYYRMTPLTVYEIEDFTEGRADHPFIVKFLSPLSMRALMIVRVAADNGLQAWLSVTHPDAGAFGAETRSRFARIARLFKPALALFGAWKDASDQRDAYARVLRARATALLRIDQAGRVLAPDADTLSWLDGEPALGIEDGRLCAHKSAIRQRLAEALARILAGESDEEVLGFDSEVVTSIGRRIEVLIYRVSDNDEPDWTNATRAIVYLRTEGREVLPSPQRIRSLFGLSRREAALTLLLTRGLTLAQAAQDLGISVMTSRAYLRQVFRKTGVSRQADLIRQIQASVAALL